MGEAGLKPGAEDDDANDDTGPQTQVMQRLDALAHVGNTRAHVEHQTKGVVRQQGQGRDRQATLEPED